jgi:Tfp pilus assembly protein PilF
MYHLGLAYYKKGEPERAKAELERALKLSDKFDGAEEAKKTLAEIK